MLNSWKIAFIGTAIHLFLGTVYAWSFFQPHIMELTKWNNLQTSMTFGIAILSLGFTASWAGSKLQRFGSQRLTIIGGILFGLGYLLASWALSYQNILLFYAGFGVIGGIGLGLAYVTPVAVVSQWFNKWQGVATGMVVMGFGLGAFLMSKILAPVIFSYTNYDVALSFRYFGIIFMIVIPIFGYFLKFPTTKNNISEEKTEEITVNQQKKALIWLIFTLNIIAGMIFLSFQSTLYQEVLAKWSPSMLENKEVLAKEGATLIAVSAFCNGIGRLFWASISDKIGQINTFRVLIAVEILCFVGLMLTANPLIFFALVCIILLCYGGGFGVLPSLVRAEFGKKNASKIYGQILTGWGIGGIIGTFLTSFLKDKFSTDSAFYIYFIGCSVILVAFFLSLTIRKSKS